MVMSYSDDCLKTVPQMANAFNIYFSSNFNHTETPAIVYESGGSLKRDDILLSLNPSIIREMILDMKESPTVTNDFLPPKLLRLRPEVFATLLHPIFCSIIISRSYAEVWKRALIRPIFKNAAKTSLLITVPLVSYRISVIRLSVKKTFCLTVNRLPRICT